MQQPLGGGLDIDSVPITAAVGERRTQRVVPDDAYASVARQAATPFEPSVVVEHLARRRLRMRLDHLDQLLGCTPQNRAYELSAVPDIARMPGAIAYDEMRRSQFGGCPV